ncbi:unnamed protein product [Pleuronectes platessa]|uniref:Uncharacterized protein n=1 Tax=Pleuronectes platessa TaxID=8262 RepID=A0A9N7UX50_PLEPL|nr:unnamed protein product [Pleuronectes platessa]
MCTGMGECRAACVEDVHRRRLVPQQEITATAEICHRTGVWRRRRLWHARENATGACGGLLRGWEMSSTQARCDSRKRFTCMPEDLLTLRRCQEDVDQTRDLGGTVYVACSMRRCGTRPLRNIECAPHRDIARSEMWRAGRCAPQEMYTGGDVRSRRCAREEICTQEICAAGDECRKRCAPQDVWEMCTRRRCAQQEMCPAEIDVRRRRCGLRRWCTLAGDGLACCRMCARLDFEGYVNFARAQMCASE